MKIPSKTSPVPKTILVVDDDASVLALVGYMLESGGYNVLVAPSAETALRLVRRNDRKIDLALLNVLTPDLPGPVLAERIFAIQPRIKVFFMSGYVDFEVLSVKTANHGLKLLPAPFTSTALLNAVASMLRTRAQRSAAAAAGGYSISGIRR